MSYNSASNLAHNRELTQQDGCKTQDGRMTKKCGVRLCIPGLARHSFRHSAVLLRKVPNFKLASCSSDFEITCMISP